MPPSDHPTLDVTTVYADHRAEVAAEVAQEQHRREAAQDRILARLRQGPAKNYELAEICLRYTGRMSDLRLHHGIRIDKRHLEGGVWEYRLLEDVPCAL